MHFLWLFALAFIIYFRAPTPQASGPSYLAHTSKVYNTSNLAKPAGVQDGDLLVIFLRDYYDGTPPSGWTAIATPNGGVPTSYAVAFYRVAASEPSNYDGVFQHYADAILVAFRGASGISGAGAWDNETSGTTHDNPGLSASGLLIGLAYVDSYSAGGGMSTVTDPAGFTRYAHLGNGGYGGMFVVGKAGGGNGSTVTWSVSSESYCFSLLFAIQ